MTLAAIGRWASLFVLLVSVIRPANAEPLCASCEIQLGVGGTYHFWGSTDGVVLPLTVSWDENRYEVGVFRMASRQTLSKDGTSQALADPYWGVSASRRWKLMERGPVRAYFGFGLAYREEADVLSATRWDFASQLGLRMRLPRNGSAVELTFRHWSNAGIKQPNHGQDFATLTFLVNPEFFSAARLDQGRDLQFIHSRESQAAIWP
jgi:lipid A 3-O-deacylase PagL